MSSEQIGTPAVSTSGLLGVLFIGLKLTNHISWPWIWVLSPFWIPAAFAVVLLTLAVIIYSIVEVIKNARR